MPRLTKRLIDSLKPVPGKPDTYAWDSELKGFGVRLMPTGLASYVLKYRNAEGRQRKLALARVGTVTPDEARALAKERLGDVAKGADPSAERRAIRKAITVSELCDLYLDRASYFELLQAPDTTRLSNKIGRKCAHVNHAFVRLMKNEKML